MVMRPFVTALRPGEVMAMSRRARFVSATPCSAYRVMAAARKKARWMSKDSVRASGAQGPVRLGEGRVYTDIYGHQTILDQQEILQGFYRPSVLSVRLSLLQ